MLNNSAKYKLYSLVFITILCYLFLGYYFNRQQFVSLISSFSLLFITYLFFIFYEKKEVNLFRIGILFRALFLFSTPFLSQDFYRFIWDGRLLISGISPYDYLPNEIINTLATFSDSHYLYNKMGTLSASHFSNYPPVNQLIFGIAGLLFGKSVFWSVVFFRIIIFLSDIGIYYYGRKLLLQFNQNPNKIFWYFLNPLVILELSGNLHFEGVMLFFLIVGFYNLIQNKWFLASLFIAISISVKLIPLLLLPLFWQILRIRKSIYFYASIIIVNILFFLPFLSSKLIENYTETIGLWFTNFQFNASIYYIIREIGFYFTGYNIIGIVGEITPFITILIILYFAFIKIIKTTDSIIKFSLFVLTLYFFISTTVHPWYVVNLILLSVFTKYKFPIVWSFFIVFSYYAYSVVPFKENLWLIALEYVAVISIFIFEISRKSKVLH